MGNNDALKMSGVDHFVVRNPHAEGWGGSAVDLVGCHFGVIEQSRFTIHSKGCRSGTASRSRVARIPYWSRTTTSWMRSVAESRLSSPD